MLVCSGKGNILVVAKIFVVKTKHLVVRNTVVKKL